MVAISSQCSFGADIAVQISQAIVFDKGTQPELRHKTANNLIKLDNMASCGVARFGSNFRKILILLYFLCTRSTNFLP